VANNALASKDAAMTEAFAYVVRLHIVISPYLFDVDGDAERHSNIRQDRVRLGLSDFGSGWTDQPSRLLRT
jgi:hypothetical protein